MPIALRFRLPDALFDGGNIAVWIGSGNTVYSQIRCSHYGVTQTRAAIGPAYDFVRKRRPQGRLVWVSDSRRVVEYESGARTLMTRWALSHQRDLERVLVVLSADSRMVLMGVHVAAAALAVVGASVEVGTNFDHLVKHGLQWPASTVLTDAR